MKRVRITAYEAGLVFGMGHFRRLLLPGIHWLWPWERVSVFETTKQFNAPVELSILLQDAAFVRAVRVVEVGASELVLQFTNGLLVQVLTPGRYVFWKGAMHYRFVRADTAKIGVTEPIDAATLDHRLVAPYVRSITVERHETGMLFVNGKFVQMLSSGVYYWWRNNIPIHVGRADVRHQQPECNGKEILAKSKAALWLNGYTQHRVKDVENVLLQNREHDRQLNVNFQLSLREYIGGLMLDELL